ncbi:ATP-binding protein [Anaeroselena agilis]|uniref:histidine kinase n=1 Tax=Anaeroselena agilis TaxID=3063788 RepID=A0ABU3NSZ6_9FIRM|nr:ATP-binding protein [Selenomonadales bacterium 4137-cl]
MVVELIRVVRREYKSILIVVLLVGLAGLAYIYPFHTHFRFTVSVAVLATLLLYFPRLPTFTTAVLSGIAIFIGRSAVQMTFDPVGLTQVMMINSPAIVYYISYGACFQALRIRRLVDNLPALILFLSVSDVFSNIVELLTRGEPLKGNPETVFSSLVGVAVLRAVLAVGAYYVLRRYQAFVLAEEQVARYTELTVMIAQLKAELYYLKKSSQDIEQVMEDSYWLYKRLYTRDSADSDAAQALAVARNIHEVKKDYSRVVTGIENILQPSATLHGLRLAEIFFVIEQNTRRYLAGHDKNIAISFKHEYDFVTDQHYAIVSILDDLIINAIEACGDTGAIRVTERASAGEIVFAVEDNGCGIKAEDFDLLFEVGYSTKFCPETGKMSTGLGLSHVKNLTEMLAGTVELESEVGRMTKFTVRLPVRSIVLPGEWAEEGGT